MAMPSAASIPARRPCRKLLREIIAKSAPGLMTASQVIPKIREARS
jgi:hypothetical protein